MSKFNLISSKQIIASLFTDFNVVGTDWVNKAQRHIASGVEIMEIDGYYELKVKTEKIYNDSVSLPVESKYLIGAFVKTGNNIVRLPITNEIINKDIPGIAYHSDYKAYINGNRLITNFSKGELRLIYFGIPTDDCGDVMIPNDAKVIECLPYYVIFKLSFSGYKHPILNFQDSMAMWEKHYPMAANRVNYPSIEEAQSMLEAITNPFYTNMVNLLHSDTAIPNNQIHNLLNNDNYVH